MPTSPIIKYTKGPFHRLVYNRFAVVMLLAAIHIKTASPLLSVFLKPHNCVYKLAAVAIDGYHSKVTGHCEQWGLHLLQRPGARSDSFFSAIVHCRLSTFAILFPSQGFIS